MVESACKIPPMVAREDSADPTTRAGQASGEVTSERQQTTAAPVETKTTRATITPGLLGNVLFNVPRSLSTAIRASDMVAKSTVLDAGYQGSE